MANTKRRCECGHWIADHYGQNGCAYFHCACIEKPSDADIRRECNGSCRDSITARKKCRCICGGSLHGSSHSEQALLQIASER